jgi:hypothetical protein
MKMESYSPKRNKALGPIVVMLALAGVLVLGVWLFTGGGENPAESDDAPQPQADAPAAAPPAVVSPSAQSGETKDSAGLQELTERNEPAEPTRQTDEPDAATNNENSPTATNDDSKSAEPREDPKAVYGPEGMTAELADRIGPSPLTIPPVAENVAQAAYARGMELFAQNKDLLEARKQLNLAYPSGHLSKPQQISAREALSDLANRTVLKPDSYVNPKDPYMCSHTFALGESLLSKRDSVTKDVTTPGIIARYNLNVPHRIITWVNGLRSSTEFRGGQSYKLIRGPFHLVVYKEQRAADLYLQDLFVRRFPVCIGAPETPTPEGYFRIVSWSGKSANSTYYPPAETGLPNIAIYPGDPDYPLGPKGLNIKIEGIPALGTNILASQSYALHGTNEPDSVGKAESRGCLRFRAKDIEFLYGALQDYAAPDDTKTTWTRWSTITIRP